ncbi:MAG: hypothetical protein ABIR36_05535 [Nitrospiraceae bacterium]
MTHPRFQLYTTTVLAILLLGTTVSAQSIEPSALAPKTGPAIQNDSSLPWHTRRGRCNPADTRCQLPRHRVQSKDSDLNGRTESGRRLNMESSLNNQSRTGPALDAPDTK